MSHSCQVGCFSLCHLYTSLAPDLQPVSPDPFCSSATFAAQVSPLFLIHHYPTCCHSTHTALVSICFVHEPSLTGGMVFSYPNLLVTHGNLQTHCCSSRSVVRSHLCLVQLNSSPSGLPCIVLVTQLLQSPNLRQAQFSHETQTKESSHAQVNSQKQKQHKQPRQYVLYQTHQPYSSEDYLDEPHEFRRSYILYQRIHVIQVKMNLIKNEQKPH